MQLQPISGKPNPPIRQFVVRERVLFMNDVADTFQKNYRKKHTKAVLIILLTDVFGILLPSQQVRK